MPIPNERGYVTIAKTTAGTYDVAVHAALSKGGRPINPFAFYRHVDMIVDSPLVLRRYAQQRYSDHVVQVYPDAAGVIHVAEPAVYTTRD